MTKLVRICSKCYKPFSQGPADKTLCDLCTFTCFDTRNSSDKLCNKKTSANKWNSKLKCVKFQRSPVKRPLQGSLSPFKSSKNIRNRVVKNLSTIERARLLYKKKIVQPKQKGVTVDSTSSVPGANSNNLNLGNTKEILNCTNEDNRQINLDSAASKKAKLQQKVDVDRQVKKNNQQVLKKVEKVKEREKTRCDEKKQVSNESIVNDKNVQLHTDKSGFTLKSIEKGLVLMTFPEPDKELDMSFDSTDEEDAENVLSEQNEIKRIDENKGLIDENKQLTTITAKQVIPSKEKNDVEGTYVMGANQTLIAHYRKTADQSEDFHLSSLYAKEESGKCKPLQISKDCSITAIPSKDMPCLLTSAASGKTITTAVKTHSVQFPESNSPLTKESDAKLPKVSGTSVTVVPCNAVVPFKDPPTANISDTYANHSSKSSPQNQKKDSELSDAITLVLHELDAIAILSILDLDGNEQHANNLLDNLLMKEIEDFQNLKELCQESLDGDLKNIAASKSQAKLGRIKSLNIARALMKKYGKLSNIVETILSQSPSKETPHGTATTSTTAASTIPTTTATGSNLVEKSTHLVPYIHKITKLEKNTTLNDCALAKSSNTLNIPTNSQNNPSSMQHQLNPTQSYSFNTEAPAPNLSAASAVVKVEAPGASSSCMLSDLLTRPHADQEYVRDDFTLNAATPSSAINMPASPFILSNLTGPDPCSSQPTQGSCTPSSTAGFNPATLPVSASASMTLVPVSSATSVPSPVHVKGENEKTLPSCQLQSNNQSGVNLYNNCAVDMPQIQQKIAPPPLGTGLPPVSMSYRTILPASNMSKPNNMPCPNRTVPFASNVIQPMNLNRNLVPMNYGGNSVTNVTSSNNIIQGQPPSNALRVQQVVLSNVQPPPPPPPYQPPNTFALTHYNYVMPQQSVANPMLMPPQSVVPNVYTLYPTMPQTSQAMHMSTVAPHSQGTGMVSQPTPLAGNVLRLPMKCVVCGKPPAMRCKQCAKVVYCSAECAKLYWNRKHKLECKLLL